MRINLNLAVHQSVHERYALYWATPVALGALVALVVLAASAQRTIREYGADGALLRSTVQVRNKS